MAARCWVKFSICSSLPGFHILLILLSSWHHYYWEREIWILPLNSIIWRHNAAPPPPPFAGSEKSPVWMMVKWQFLKRISGIVGIPGWGIFVGMTGLKNPEFSGALISVILDWRAYEGFHCLFRRVIQIRFRRYFKLWMMALLQGRGEMQTPVTHTVKILR